MVNKAIVWNWRTIPWKADGINLLYKPHNALDKYLTMHHSVTGICTRAHFCYKMVHCGIFVRCIVGFVRWCYSASNHSLAIQKHTYCLFGCNTYTLLGYLPVCGAGAKYTELRVFAYKKRNRLKISQTTWSSGQRHGCWHLVYEANIVYCVTGGICFSSTGALLRNVVFVPSLVEVCRNKHDSLTLPGTATHLYIS